MEKYRNRLSGALYETSNEKVIEQFKKHPELYEEVKPEGKKQKSKKK